MSTYRILRPYYDRALDLHLRAGATIELDDPERIALLEEQGLVAELPPGPEHEPQWLVAVVVERVWIPAEQTHEYQAVVMGTGDLFWITSETAWADPEGAIELFVHDEVVILAAPAGPYRRGVAQKVVAPTHVRPMRRALVGGVCAEEVYAWVVDGERYPRPAVDSTDAGPDRSGRWPKRRPK